MGRKISYQLLRSKITDLWKPSEPLTLIDLGHGFYTAKFNKEENKTTALHGGPRFIVGRFLSMISWKLSFVLSISTMTHTAIWVRLPQLPTELYDWQILKKIDTISVDQRQSQDIDNRFNVLSENIPVEKNVQSPTVADKTLKVMSIKPNAPLRDQPI
ncbi:hypothetical protein FXO38_05445 [Capsicum annuum]|nr:hypothetical protein FXO38_05445 [Capsicum annuum]